MRILTNLSIIHAALNISIIMSFIGLVISSAILSRSDKLSGLEVPFPVGIISYVRNVSMAFSGKFYRNSSNFRRFVVILLRFSHIFTFISFLLFLAWAVMDVQ